MKQNKFTNKKVDMTDAKAEDEKADMTDTKAENNKGEELHVNKETKSKDIKKENQEKIKSEGNNKSKAEPDKIHKEGKKISVNDKKKDGEKKDLFRKKEKSNISIKSSALNKESFLEQFQNVKLYEEYDTDYKFNSNTFVIFNSICGKILLIFLLNPELLVSYDLFYKSLVFKMKLKTSIHSISYIKNKDLNRDWIFLHYNNILKIAIYDANKWECLFNIEPYLLKRDIMFFHHCTFKRIDDNIYLFLSNSSNKKYLDKVSFKPFKTEIIKKDMKKKILYIENFDNNDKMKNYILLVKRNKIISYNVNCNQKYRKYIDFDCFDYESAYFDICVYVENLYLIQGGKDNQIRIWNFNSGEFFKRIFINGNFKINSLFSMNLCEIILGCSNEEVKQIKLINPFEETVSQISYFNDSSTLFCKFLGRVYGTFFISKTKQKIQIWNMKLNH